MTRTTTALSDFGRTLRDEPLYGIYKNRIYMTQDNVPAEPVKAWLRKLYVEARKGKLYRVVEYTHKDGNRYVDYILMQSTTEKELLELKMRWGYSENRVQRGERLPRRKMTKEQSAAWKVIVADAKRAFFEAQDAAHAAQDALEAN